MYQTVSAQAAAIHEMFVTAMQTSAGSYAANAVIRNGPTLRHVVTTPVKTLRRGPHD